VSRRVVTPALRVELEAISERAQQLADLLDPQRRGGSDRSTRGLLVRELDVIARHASAGARFVQLELDDASELPSRHGSHR
jgi:hypothetical protein